MDEPQDATGGEDLKDEKNRRQGGRGAYKECRT